jgi:integrase/recombinase XerD
MGTRPKLMEHEKALTPQEKEVLMTYLATPAMEWTRPAAIMRLVLKAGLRASEVAHLQVKHCILEGERPMICVWGGKKREQDEVDVVKVGKDFAAYLLGFIQRAGSKVFVFEKDGHGLTRNTIWTDCKKVYKNLGFSAKYGVHALRHRFVTDTYKAFRDPVIAMNQARHKNLAVTTRYIHLATEESEEFRSKLEMV